MLWHLARIAQWRKCIKSPHAPLTSDLSEGMNTPSVATGRQTI